LTHKSQHYTIIAGCLRQILCVIMQAKILKVKLLLATKDYSGAIAETGYILKEDENDLDALLVRGRAYYYLADHDVAMRFVRRILRITYSELVGLML